ncbi:MAG: hypothetical protein DRQ61_07930 [Gammaproteobacteria bacterium]|nr:MAG: hypothetical protein DRQ61_07930 [Gammaproteobacteria bacterium]RLA48425.1 MAG: hypothetical protein DRR42_16760 [Gammaproteobacteria bacterium]
MVDFSDISQKINEDLEGRNPQSKPKISQEKAEFKYVLPENYQFDNNAKRAFSALTVEKKPVIFLTGRAGTGKTTFIHYVKKNFAGNIAILTPTGMTALNIGGQTIHSFFRFPPRAFEDNEIKDYHNKAIAHLDLIIIDEVSMVQSDLLDHIDFALRKWRKSSSPFGGIQMLLVGDCFQLSPWIKFGAEKKRFEEKYRSQWFFDANVFDSVSVEAVNLTSIYRQKDSLFINILNRIRIKYNHEKYIKELNKCCYYDKKGQQTEDQLILTTTNNRADVVNAARLGFIDSPSQVYKASEKGKITKEVQKTIPLELELKVGAQVMVTKNIKGAANGTLAIVKQMLGDRVIIETIDDQISVECSTEIWEQFNYEWDEVEKSISSHKTGEYRQVPLRLGWAITIHKSQGLTFDSVNIDLTGGAFSPGQTYVALSRCRTLERVTFHQPISLADIIVDPKILEFYKRIFNLEVPKKLSSTGANDAVALSNLGAQSDKHYHQEGGDLVSEVELSTQIEEKIPIVFDDSPLVKADITSDFRHKYVAMHRATDGHFVRSKAEMLIDNWLYMAEIAHAYERKLPVEEEVYSDFYVPRGKVYIEFWGYDNNAKYLARKQKKQAIYQKYNFNLIELTDEEVLNLDDILPLMLLEYGVQAY